MNQYRLALKLAREGFSVIPLLADSKRPAVRWKQYQNERATPEELAAWFSDRNYTVGIVTGSLSGITVIDCDTRDLADAWPEPSPIQQWTKRGRHFVYRHNGERNTVAVSGTKGIDRRGEGGYVVAYAECVHWTREAIDAAPSLPASHAMPAGLDDADWPVHPLPSAVATDEEDFGEDMPDDPEHDVYDFDESCVTL
jgi:hypothetical protein